MRVAALEVVALKEEARHQHPSARTAPRPSSDGESRPGRVARARPEPAGREERQDQRPAAIAPFVCRPRATGRSSASSPARARRVPAADVRRRSVALQRGQARQDREPDGERRAPGSGRSIRTRSAALLAARGERSEDVRDGRQQRDRAERPRMGSRPRQARSAAGDEPEHDERPERPQLLGSFGKNQSDQTSVSFQ